MLGTKRKEISITKPKKIGQYHVIWDKIPENKTWDNTSNAETINGILKVNSMLIIN